MCLWPSSMIYSSSSFRFSLLFPFFHSFFFFGGGASTWYISSPPIWGTMLLYFPLWSALIFSLFHGKYRLKCFLGLFTNLGTHLQTGKNGLYLENRALFWVCDWSKIWGSWSFRAYWHHKIWIIHNNFHSTRDCPLPSLFFFYRLVFVNTHNYQIGMHAWLLSLLLRHSRRLWGWWMSQLWEMKLYFSILEELKNIFMCLG